ncbi:hypothetical protein Aph02nite_40290 [Actinoplanes philippinensis]|nr:hypothetical protein Aph02nite_40290 [Actinoplanes philippinensis]
MKAELSGEMATSAVPGAQPEPAIATSSMDISPAGGGSTMTITADAGAAPSSVDARSVSATAARVNNLFMFTPSGMGTDGPKLLMHVNRSQQPYTSKKRLLMYIDKEEGEA